MPDILGVGVTAPAGTGRRPPRRPRTGRTTSDPTRARHVDAHPRTARQGGENRAPVADPFGVVMVARCAARCGGED
ncbi:hypothetical protein [Mycobacterium sp. 29Ha]|uniref:hypothetical protein n=1 Tax=Mycobacterium sp. 29Ha TaxID=2939268 RepID=UPI0029390B98|nr:hypothetical protein [Mycobacterium sp. 29Ha]MDV3136745.1 hypothetical protein [Mycobacterium sp. 29Ha]